MHMSTRVLLRPAESAAQLSPERVPVLFRWGRLPVSVGTRARLVLDFLELRLRIFFVYVRKHGVHVCRDFCMHLDVFIRLRPLNDSNTMSGESLEINYEVRTRKSPARWSTHVCTLPLA